MTARWPFLVLLAVVCLALVFLAGRAFGRRGASAVLPPPVVAAVQHEQADRPGVDSQLIAASLEAVAARQRQAVAETKAVAIQRIADHLSRYADSLANRASMAQTAADSAHYWREAYQTRTDERDTLRYELAEKDTALKAANERAMALTRALGIADSARQRADSVIDAVVDAANKAECRVPLTFGLVRCMSRTKAALVGAAVGVGGTLAVQRMRDGRLKIPLPFLRSRR